MFNEVPLVNIDTKELTIKVPALTSEDIDKYASYLSLRVEQNQKILEDWTSMINETLAMCGTTDKSEAKKIKDELVAQKAIVQDPKIQKILQTEIDDMQAIINLSGNTTRKEM
jgi:hypothetical protein